MQYYYNFYIFLVYNYKSEIIRVKEENILKILNMFFSKLFFREFMTIIPSAV